MGGLWMAGCGLWAGGEFVAIEILNVGHVQTSLFSLVGRAPALVGGRGFESHRRLSLFCMIPNIY